MKAAVRIGLKRAVWLLCALPFLVWAEPQTPSLQSLLKQVSSLPASEAWQQLQRYADQFLRDPDYNYALGLYALASGQYGQAINAFERVVLLQPNHAGAWLDLAIAYHRAGDNQTALELLNYIRTHLDPPAHILRLLQQWALEWRPPTPWSARFSLEIGHSSNPAAAPTSAGMSLYLGEWTPLTLSRDYRPHSSPYVGMGIDLQRTWTGHQVLVGAKLRRYSQTDQANQHQLLLSWQPPEDGWGYWHLSFSLFNMASSGTQYTLSMLRLLPLSHGWSAGAGMRVRRYQQPELDANIPLVLLTYTKPTAHGTMGFSAWYEQEYATGDRPGGGGHRATASMVWQRPFSIEGLQLAANISHYQDHKNYSALIPLRRALCWHQLRLQWYRALGKQTQLQLSVQHDWQRANHRLFEWRDTQVAVSINYWY